MAPERLAELPEHERAALSQFFAGQLSAGQLSERLSFPRGQAAAGGAADPPEPPTASFARPRRLSLRTGALLVAALVGGGIGIAVGSNVLTARARRSTVDARHVGLVGGAARKRTHRRPAPPARAAAPAAAAAVPSMSAAPPVPASSTTAPRTRTAPTTPTHTATSRPTATGAPTATGPAPAGTTTGSPSPRSGTTTGGHGGTQQGSSTVPAGTHTTR